MFNYPVKSFALRAATPKNTLMIPGGLLLFATGAEKASKIKGFEDRKHRIRVDCFIIYVSIYCLIDLIPFRLKPFDPERVLWSKLVRGTVFS